MAAEESYGGFWVRLIAYMVDSVIVVTLLFLVVGGLAFLGDAGMLIVPLVYLLPLAYFVLLQSSARQATLGKQLLGLKVVTVDGERISMLRSLGRELGKILSSIPLGIGFLLAAFTGRKQALHDMVASTTVVREGGSVILGLLVAVFGWVAPAAVIMALGMGILAAMMGTTGAGLLQQAMKGAQTQASLPQPAPRKPVAGQPAQPPAPAKPVATPATPAKDVETVLAAKLTSDFDKAGTTRAGPAVLELSTTFPSSFWIKVYLPPMDEFAGDSAVVVALNRVIDASGAELYDPKHNLETAFFQKVSLRPAPTPVPHLAGTRTVSLRSGASTAALGTVEGVARFRIPAKPLPASFTAGDVGKAQSAHGVAITLRDLKGKDVGISVAGDTSRLVRTIAYGADGGRLRQTSWSTNGGEMNFSFEQPVTRLEVVVAEQFVERAYPFTLGKASMAVAPKPPALAAPPAPPAPPVAQAPLPAPTPKVVEAAPKAEKVAKAPRRELPAPVQARTRDLPPAPSSAAAPERTGPKYNDVMTAVLHGDADAVNELLALGRWVDKPDSRGVTPLAAAAYRGDVKTAELLLKAGANADAAMGVARERRDPAMTDLLEKYRK